MLNFRLYESGSVRISGIEFVGRGYRNPNSVRDVGIQIDGAVKDLQIHDCAFRGFGFAGVAVDGNAQTFPGQPTGVIYNNSFSDMLFVRESGDPNLGYGVSVYGDGAAARPPLDLGGASAIFVEGNTFRRVRHAIAANSNVRYVFRYNNVQEWWAPWGAVDAHGRSCCGHGARSFEIYKNRFVRSLDHETGEERTSWTIYLRGGDGVVFGNVVRQPRRSNAGRYGLTVEGDPTSIGDYPFNDQTGRLGPQAGLYFWDNYYRTGSSHLKEAELTVGLANGVAVGAAAQLRQALLEGVVALEPPEGYAPYPYPHPLRD